MDDWREPVMRSRSFTGPGWVVSVVVLAVLTGSLAVSVVASGNAQRARSLGGPASPLEDPVGSWELADGAHVVAVDPGGGAGTRANPLPPDMTSLPAQRQVLGPSNQDTRSQLINYREADAESIDDLVAATMRPVLVPVDLTRVGEGSAPEVARVARYQVRLLEPGRSAAHRDGDTAAGRPGSADVHGPGDSRRLP